MVKKTTTSSQIYTISLDQKNQWETLISVFKYSRIFHSWNWAKTFADAYGHNPVLICFGKDGIADFVLPVSEVKRPFGKSYFVSMPYSDFAGPLFKNSISDELWIKILEELDSDEIEIRSDIQLFDISDKSDFSTYRISLPSSLEEMQANLPSKSVRYPIRKARRDGFSVRRGLYEDVSLFHHLMSITRRKHGLPTPPLKFYQALYRNVIQPGNGTMYIAENLNGKPVASSLFLWHKEMGYYKYNASDRVASVGNANHLLLWEGVSEAIERKCSSFDLGRASSTNQGLIKFKKHWLGKEVVLQYVHVHSNSSFEAITSEESKVFVISQKVFHRFPVFLSKIVGTHIYKYFS